MMCRLQTPEGRKDFAESQKYVRIMESECKILCLSVLSTKRILYS